MRIGIDARLWSESGVGRYIRNLVRELEKLDKENDYFIFLLEKNFNNESFNKNFTKVKADIKWYGLSEQTKLPQILEKYKLDLVHFPHFNVPFLYSGKFVVTIHDLIHQHYNFQRASTKDPLTFKLKQFGYKKIFGNALKKSEHILVPSNFVKDQLIDEWKIDKEKNDVTYEGVEDNFLNLVKKITSEKSKKVIAKFNVKIPFIFYVGNAHPHKNVEGLIKAFLELRKNYQYLQLVLSGSDHYFWQRIKKEFSNKDIIYTGFVTEEELAALYYSSQAFVMPSFEEGFGLPILEAMAAGVPVVSSNAGSLKEVGGDAALYFDPRNTDDMVEKMSQILNDQKLRKQLVEKGQKRYKEFSWKKLAEETLGVYKKSI